MHELTTPTLSRTLAAMAEGLTLRRVGVDAVHIPGWRRCLDVGGDRLLRRTYTESELAFCEGRIERLATRFAAKEAVLKVLGSGIAEIGMNEVEVVSEASGRPRVQLQGQATATAEALGLSDFELSLCHEEDYGLALATARQEDLGG